MSRIKKEFERRLEERYKSLKSYLNDEDSCKELHDMCKQCECYCGNEHEYSECRDKNCFRFYLGYSYLDLATGYEVMG